MSSLYDQKCQKCHDPVHSLTGSVCPVVTKSGARDCTNCGAPRHADSPDKFCTNCGTRLPLGQDDPAVQKALGLARLASAGSTTALVKLGKLMGVEAAIELTTLNRGEK